MNLPPLPSAGTLLPRGHYLVTADLVTALDRIAGGPGDVWFPERPGRWIRLPHGTVLSVYEDEQHERLCCKHEGDPGDEFDRDQLVLDRGLDG